MKSKKGISLIVLIITIIVIIILATIIILNLNKNNPVSSANQARFKSDVKGFQEELLAYINLNLSEKENSKIITSDYPTLDEMEKYIADFSTKYENKLGIYNNDLVYYKDSTKQIKNEVTDEEEKWLIELGIKKKVIETSSDSFEWGSDDSNNPEYYTLKKFKGNEVNVVVPKRCHKIADEAFKSSSNIETVELQSGVTDIGKRSFAYCYELSNINFPEGITNINDNAFYQCKKLDNIILPDTIGAVGIGSFAFDSCESLTRIVIPKNVKYIYGETFMGCISLQEVVFPDSLKGIYEQAFDGCTSLKSINFPSDIVQINDGAFCNTGLTDVNIPPKVYYIGDGPFRSCKSLSSITVDTNNSYFSSEDGILYDKKKTKIIQFPAGKNIQEFSIASGITTISPQSFLGVDTIEKINIPSTVTTIGYNAFHSCSSLKTINFPDSVQTIGNSPFYNSPDLTIYCECSEDNIPSGWDKSWKFSVNNIVYNYTN